MQFIFTADDLHGTYVERNELLSFARWTISHRGVVIVTHRPVTLALSEKVAPDNVIRAFSTLEELNAAWDSLIGKKQGERTWDSAEQQ